mgnify:FL=1
MLIFMKKIILALIICFVFITRVNAENEKISSDVINLKSQSGIIIEADTGKVLFEKDADTKRPPASMTKIMTMLLIAEELEKGNILLKDEVAISERAASMGGSQIYLEKGSTATVEELLTTIAVGSANDSAVAMAEKIGGTVENFVVLMNKRAKELGANNTTFKNPHGLDEEGHETTARDMALIAKEVVKHDNIIKLSSTYETTIRHKNGKSLWLVNTNSLIKFYSGLDGLKTGFTDKAGYCLTGTMKRNDMRLITVVMHAETKEDRNTDTINMMEYAYSMYNKKTLVSSENYLGNMFIDNAKSRKVKYYLEKDANVIVDKNTREVNYKYDIELDNIKAPLKKGDKIGTLKLNYNNEIIDYNLIVKEDVYKSNFFTRMKNYFKDILNGSINALGKM